MNKILTMLEGADFELDVFACSQLVHTDTIGRLITIPAPKRESQSGNSAKTYMLCILSGLKLTSI